MEDNQTPETDDTKPEEPLEDMTPEKDAMGGGPHVKVFDGRNLAGSRPSLDAQKKEIADL